MNKKIIMRIPATKNTVREKVSLCESYTISIAVIILAIWQENSKNGKRNKLSFTSTTEKDNDKEQKEDIKNSIIGMTPQFHPKNCINPFLK